MPLRLSTIVFLVVVAGCSKGLAGDYKGTLTETCTMVRMTDEKVGPDGQSTAKVTSKGGGASTDGYTLRVVSGAKDKLEVTIKGCKVAFTAKDSMATANPDQSCVLDVKGCSGKTVVDGVLSSTIDGGAQLTINFVATGPGASGAYVLDFHGSRNGG